VFRSRSDHVLRLHVTGLDPEQGLYDRTVHPVLSNRCPDRLLHADLLHAQHLVFRHALQTVPTILFVELVADRQPLHCLRTLPPLQCDLSVLVDGRDVDVRDGEGGVEDGLQCGEDAVLREGSWLEGTDVDAAIHGNGGVAQDGRCSRSDVGEGRPVEGTVARAVDASVFVLDVETSGAFHEPYVPY
jgi:hypothetical protein